MVCTCTENEGKAKDEVLSNSTKEKKYKYW